MTTRHGLDIIQLTHPGDADPAARKDLPACWIAVTNAGAAAGFPFPPVNASHVAPAVDTLADGLESQRSRILLARTGGTLAGWGSPQLRSQSPHRPLGNRQPPADPARTPRPGHRVGPDAPAAASRPGRNGSRATPPRGPRGNRARRLLRPTRLAGSRPLAGQAPAFPRRHQRRDPDDPHAAVTAPIPTVLIQAVGLGRRATMADMTS